MEKFTEAIKALVRETVLEVLDEFTAPPQGDRSGPHHRALSGTAALEGVPEVP